MAANTLEAKQHAHELLEQLGPGQLAAVVNLLEVMIHEDDDELTEEDRGLISASREYFRQNPEGGISFEDLAAECGFTMDQIRKLAVALSVSADMLLFEDQERGPDDDLKLQFEAVTRLDPAEKKVIRSVIESIILRHEARRWSASGAEK
jgi:hypothetical protein